MATIGVALAVGVPTGVVPSPLYRRMTPVLWWNYPVWAATAVLGGLLLATYVQRPGEMSAQNGLKPASGGGLLAAFAVGCPVCNKLVVAVLGVSGALNLWAPVQPLLGVVSVAGLAWALRRRITNEYACPAPRPADVSAAAQKPMTGAQAGPWPFVASPRPSPERPTAEPRPLPREGVDAHADSQRSVP